MAAFFIRIVVTLPVLLLWFVVVDLIGRAFGVRLPFRSLRKRNTSGLTFSQHLWLTGVLGWGCGMWIFTTLGDYLDWKYWNGSAQRLSAETILFHAVLWPLMGVFFGWMTWNARTDKAEG